MDQKIKKSFELDRIRSDFPILDQEINGSKLIYFDNAASTQKPKSVIKSIKQYYESDHSNVHRGVHSLSIRATEAYEQSRRVISNYINAKQVSRRRGHWSSESSFPNKISINTSVSPGIS